MDLTQKAISRLTAPSAVLTAWGFFALAVVLTLTGEGTRALLRFVSVWAMAVSISAGVRILGGGATRGANWGGRLAMASLPYFDGELKDRDRYRSGGVERAIAGILFCGAGLAGTVLLTAGQPAEDGVVVLGENVVESWRDSSRSGLSRELPARLQASPIDLQSGRLELSADRLQNGWESSATLEPGQAVGLGDLEVEWIGVLPNDSVGGVEASVSFDGAQLTATFVVGRPVEVGEAQVVLTEFQENRYGALGPAGRFTVRNGDETHAHWVFLWGGPVTAADGDDAFAIEMTGLQASSSAVLRVRSGTSPFLVPFVSGFLVLIALLGARLLTGPVSLRGKSGDYELVGVTRRSVDSAGRAMLDPDGTKEWHGLLESLRRTSRGA
ncbi:MAG: hypothetical protein ACJAYU_003171 [Bradymonadia bacterium]|jgi:hypothetical protein